MLSFNPFGSGSSDPASRKPPSPSIGDLSISLVDLLQQAFSLPQPSTAFVRETGSMSLMFPPVPASEQAISMWGCHFGGVFAVETYLSEAGAESHICLMFDFHGVLVEVYADIPA